MLNDPRSFYQEELSRHQKIAANIQQKLVLYVIFRLLAFLLIAVSIFLFWNDLRLLLGIVLPELGLFLFLVKRNGQLRYDKRYSEALVEMNKLELQVLDGDTSGLVTGAAYTDGTHFFNQDIDLFGDGSVFQQVNRTRTVSGEQELAAMLNSNHIEDIPSKQEAIQDLRKKMKWVQNFQVNADLIKKKVENTTVLDWMKTHVSVIPSIFRFLPLIYSTLSLIGVIGYSLGYVSGTWISLWFFLGLGITGLYLRQVTKLYMSVGEISETFKQYTQLLKAIEDEDFDSVLLKEQQNKILSGQKKASAVLAKLSAELNSLDQRNNILFVFVGNGLLLWDLRYAYRIEKWIEENKDGIDEWFEAIRYFDAQNSLAVYAFNHPNYVFPEISDDQSTVIEAKDFGHPLLDPDQRVDNDLKINQTDFFIITGANMAGKSTFLRTVGSGIVMANVGLPVCASSFIYTPVKLITSMRTTDSLQNDESYFFSELKRLKFIVEKTKEDDYFIILDEILKGTNSKDKEEGSKKFVEKLVGTKSTGIIATHDLTLCDLADKLPQIKNHYFDAEIVNDELFFDYQFKSGICKNMNASFLLRKMEIV